MLPLPLICLMTLEMQRHWWAAWLQQFDTPANRYWVWENVCYPEVFGWEMCDAT